MKVLLLTPQLPYPPHQGTSLRNFHVLQGLAQAHEVTLLSFLADNQTAEAAAIAPLLALCRALKTVPVPRRTPGDRLRQLLFSRRSDIEHRLRSVAFDIALRRMLAETFYDVVQIEGLELARRMETVRAVSPRSRLVFDAHNAETELQRRALQADAANPRRWVAAAYSWVQIGRLQRLERWACETADGVVAVSEQDREALLRLAPDLRAPVSVIPNCIDVAGYAQPPGEAIHDFDLVFSGKMDYRPNVDAVLWFADEVWPRIRAQRPQTTWAIVGQKPHPRLERIRELPGVTVTGWVPDVRPYLAGAAVYVMPFRVGSGTRLKLIEAMAAGKAVVSTRLGAEGFAVQHGREVWLADTAAEMETAVVQLLAQPELRRQLGDAAQQFAQRYDWRAITPRFSAVYTELLHQ